MYVHSVKQSNAQKYKVRSEALTSCWLNSPTGAGAFCMSFIDLAHSIIRNADNYCSLKLESEE